MLQHTRWRHLCVLQLTDQQYYACDPLRVDTASKQENNCIKCRGYRLKSFHWVKHLSSAILIFIAVHTVLGYSHWVQSCTFRLMLSIDIVLLRKDFEYISSVVYSSCVRCIILWTKMVLARHVRHDEQHGGHGDVTSFFVQLYVKLVYITWKPH